MLFHFPSRHKLLLTKKRIRVLSAMCWLLAFSLFATIFFIPIYSGRTNYKFRCIFSNYVSQNIFDYVMVPFASINLTLILVFYGRMLYLLKQRDRDMGNIATSRNQGTGMSSDAATNVTKLAIFVIGKSNMLIPYINTIRDRITISQCFFKLNFQGREGRGSSQFKIEKHVYQFLCNFLCDLVFSFRMEDGGRGV